MFIKPLHMRFGVGESKVVHPADDETVQVVSNDFDGYSLVAARQLTYLAFGSFQSFAVDANSHSAVSSIEAEAQELAFGRQVHCAFLLIDFQAHTLFQEPFRAFHHALACPFAFDENVAVG